MCPGVHSWNHFGSWSAPALVTFFSVWTLWRLFPTLDWFPIFKLSANSFLLVAWITKPAKDTWQIGFYCIDWRKHNAVSDRLGSRSAIPAWNSLSVTFSSDSILGLTSKVSFLTDFSRSKLAIFTILDYQKGQILWFLMIYITNIIRTDLLLMSFFSTLYSNFSMLYFLSIRKVVVTTSSTSAMGAGGTFAVVAFNEYLIQNPFTYRKTLAINTMLLSLLLEQGHIRVVHLSSC